MKIDQDKPDFQTVFEAVPGLYLVLSPDFRIVGASEAYLRATMTRRKEILGRNIFEIFPDNPADPEATGVSNLRDSLERVVRTKAPDTMAVQKYDVRRPDSEGGGFEERHWSPMNCPVLDDHGCLRHIIHRVEDVTDFVRLKQKGAEQARQTEDFRQRADRMEAEIFLRAQEVQEMNRQLRAANEALGELDRAKTLFFSNISHEFRTPLTLMLGPLEDEMRQSTGARERLTIAYGNALRLLKLVNTLLDFSRIEANRAQAAYEATDLSAFTAELAGMFRSAIEKAGLRLAIDCVALPEPVYVDREMWEKIVLNLLSNAFKFTFEGEIKVVLRWGGDYAQLSVSDTGVGIPANELPRIFERFHRVRAPRARTHEGTGIGLALVQELARLHGGAISAQSIEGSGSTFSVTVKTGQSHLPEECLGAPHLRASPRLEGAVPYVEEALRWTSEASLEAAEKQANIASPQEAPAAGPAASSADEKPRVLLADDNADMRDYVQRLLKPRFIVQAVADGQAALEAAQRHLPDLVLSDVMMPRLDGFELLARLRKDARTRLVPVILLSARAGEEARVEGLERGADDYLIKPFTARELVARVCATLAMARLRQDSARLEERLKAEESAAGKLRDQAQLLEKIVQERTATLQEALGELQHFSYTITHDLRAPLRAMKGYSSILLEQETSPSHRPLLQRISSSAERMDQLITDALNYSKLAQQKFELQPVRPGVLLQEIVGAYPNLQEVRRQISIAEKMPSILGNEVALTQCFTNLLSNAVKFVQPGKLPEIRIWAEERGDWARFWVEDHGPGIPEESREKVFELFQRLGSNHEGSGIGLALVKKAAERMGGKVGVESELGKGSRFWLEFKKAVTGLDLRDKMGS